MADTELSFTERAINEAVFVPRKNQCCRRAFVLGILIGAGSAQEDNVNIRAKGLELCDYLCKLIKEQFGREAVVRCVSEKTSTYELCFFSVQASDMIRGSERAYSQIIKCGGCLGAFMCGLLCSCISINDPKKDYYLSVRTDHAHKDTIMNAFADAGVTASYRISGNKSVFYMRASSRIEDFLAICGMQKMLFDYMNCKIEKDLRNNANRISNIEYNNIQRSVGSAQKYIEAIEWLKENDRLTGLNNELYEAARLRVENPDCSLSALGGMMSPTVSKSGVVHRLNRIYDIYTDARKKCVK